MVRPKVVAKCTVLTSFFWGGKIRKTTMGTLVKEKKYL